MGNLKTVAKAAAVTIAACAAAGLGLAAGTLTWAPGDTSQPETTTGPEVLSYEETWDLLAEVWNSNTHTERFQTCESIQALGLDTFTNHLIGYLVRHNDVVLDPNAIEDVYTEGCNL